MLASKPAQHIFSVCLTLEIDQAKKTRQDKVHLSDLKRTVVGSTEPDVSQFDAHVGVSFHAINMSAAPNFDRNVSLNPLVGSSPATSMVVRLNRNRSLAFVNLPYLPFKL